LAAEEYPLVIVTNSDDVHAKRLSENLQAPFEVVISAEEMGVYKPRLRAFEYTLDKLGVAPDEIVHVSASPKYDLRSAAHMGIKNKVYMDRGFEHDEHWLGYQRITDIEKVRAEEDAGDLRRLRAVRERARVTAC
jgi:2-haloacid dehalogenase